MNEVEKIENNEVEANNITALISKAIDKGMPIETLERLMSMRKELEQEYAKKEYDFAMAEFQGECPVIEKIKEGARTNAGIVAYMYAPLSYILLVAKPLLQKHGFSYAFDSKELENKIEVSCTVSHIKGYSKTNTPIAIPLATKTNLMSSSQQVTATISYGERKAFCQVFGIITGEDEEIFIHQKDKEFTDNEKSFITSWKKFMDILITLNGKMTEKEEESNKRIKAAQEQNKVSIKAVDDMIKYYQDKYPIDISKNLFDVESKTEPDLKLDLGDRDESNNKTN
jgi:hypothetical protein